MQKIDYFDVLIVYSGLTARSPRSRSQLPFDPQGAAANRNDTYSYFLSEAARSGLKTAFATTDDVVAAGTCSDYWITVSGKWKKVHQKCFAPVIFDKCFPVNMIETKQRSLLFSKPSVESFSSDRLVKLFFDKLTTYQKLPQMSIPTVKVKSTNEAAVRDTIAKLEKMKRSYKTTEDFGSDFILKDRFGIGGYYIFKITAGAAVAEIVQITQKNPQISFVLQPFINFEKGFSISDQTRATDIRVIYMGTQRIQSYTRTAKQGDFRCNMHQGGTIMYTKWSQLPPELLRLADKTAQELAAPNTLYAIDFIVANSGRCFLLEGNTSPGIDWYPGRTLDALHSKRLIAAILTELERRVKKNKSLLSKTQKSSSTTANFAL